MTHGEGGLRSTLAKVGSLVYRLFHAV